jgi:DNA polymerase (family 10)
MSKAEVAAALEEYAALLEIDGQDGRAHAYDNAARAIRRADRVPPNPARLNGIGNSTREAVIDLENGIGIDELDELREEYDWYTAFKDVDYIGPARAQEIHEKFNVSTLEKLDMVARNGDLKLISGIGPKTAEKIHRSIEEELRKH